MLSFEAISSTTTTFCTHLTHLSLSISLCFSFCLWISICFSISLCFSISFSISRCFSICFSISLCLDERHFLWIFLAAFFSWKFCIFSYILHQINYNFFFNNFKLIQNCISKCLQVITNICRGSCEPILYICYLSRGSCKPILYICYLSRGSCESILYICYLSRESCKPILYICYLSRGSCEPILYICYLSRVM